MKILLALLLITNIAVGEIVQSDNKPEMFYQHQNNEYFVTNIQSVGDTMYVYQAVKINNRTQPAILQSLLQHHKDSDVSFAQYRARSEQRVNFALYGYVEVQKAVNCGYDEGITEQEMKELLGVIHYAD